MEVCDSRSFCVEGGIDYLVGSADGITFDINDGSDIGYSDGV